VNCNFRGKTAVFRFWAPFGGLKAKYNVHLKVIGKRVVELNFFVRCYGWEATSEYRLKVGVFAPTGSVCPKMSCRRGHPTNLSSCQKTRMDDLSCGMRMWAQVSFVLSQSTSSTDRRTDGRKGLGNTVRYITCSRTVEMRCNRMSFRVNFDV